MSGRLTLDSALPLLQDESSRVVVVTGSERSLEGCRARVEYLRANGEPGDVDLAAALRRLRAEQGVGSLLCEGGPQLNSALLRSGLVDELFLTLAGTLAGGRDPLTIVSGPPLEPPVALELVSVMRADADLFLRYRVAAPTV